MNNKIFLNNEFDRFWNKISNGENFSLLRYGDGERSIMRGMKIKAQEGWESPDCLSELGKALLSSLNITEDNFYYGISCPCCDLSAYYWYSTRIPSKNITFANLWVNANYSRFIEKFSLLKRDAVVITNYRALGHKIGNLNILKHYGVGDDCISYWEKDAKELIQQIKEDFGSRNDLLYVISAGPMSEPIIVELYKNNPNNCYIDFGSSIDIFVHNKITRPYMDSSTPYAKQSCWMYEPCSTSFDVSVVLSAYKRIENLQVQLEALELQSVKPKEILLFQDGIEGEQSIEIPDDIIKKFDLVETSKVNKGVWARFDFARQKAKSKYVCIFDDDTIPGNRWLENCLCHMHEQEGLYGTIGILCKEDSYKDGSHVRLGWANPNEETAYVDFVGHSWFLEKTWLDYLFEETEELQKYKVCAEDMTLSYKLQTHDIYTFVPPHPENNTDLWGSIPRFSNELGNDKNSLFVNNGWNKMTEAFDLLVQKYGFQIIKNKNPKQYIVSLLLAHCDPNRKNSKMERIFSIRNEISQRGKRKVLTIFGTRIKFSTKKL